MPARAHSICLECNALVVGGGRYCELHVQNNRRTRAERERSTIRRGSGLKSLYDSRSWRTITRPFILRRDPLCQIAILCGGRQASVDVDHIQRAEQYIAAHAGDQTWFYDPQNLRGACHIDHAYKTARENCGLWSENEVAVALAAVE